MAMDVAFEVLTDPDFLIDLTVTREDPGSYVDGLFQPGSTNTFTIQASVQPATADDYKTLPEGERIDGTQVLFGRDELLGSRDNKNFDKITGYLGINWKVVASEPWGHHGYYKTTISRLAKGS